MNFSTHDASEFSSSNSDGDGVLKGIAGKRSEFIRLHSGLSAQAYRTAQNLIGNTNENGLSFSNQTDVITRLVYNLKNYF